MSEAILIALATTASLAYFSVAVAKRLAPMLHAKERNLRLDRLPARLWAVFAEVMLQARVIRERPVTGVLHALVMWGFCAFSWVSLEHFAIGLAGFEAPAGGESWYSGFAAAWAVAVLAGIGGLSFRRFALRPRSLGQHVSLTSALVSFLIIVLMVTYLADWRLLQAGSDAWKANWWAHTAALLAMLWVIPSSKHLHLLLGPLAIFFRGRVTSPRRMCWTSMRAWNAADAPTAVPRIWPGARWIRSGLCSSSSAGCWRAEESLPPMRRPWTGGKRGLPRKTSSSASPAAPASRLAPWASSMSA